MAADRGISLQVYQKIQNYSYSFSAAVRQTGVVRGEAVLAALCAPPGFMLVVKMQKHGLVSAICIE